MAVPILTSSNVRVAVTGAVYVAPTGTAAPTAVGTALNVAFKDLGYLGEDGITEDPERSTEEIRAWQNAATVRSAVTEASVSYTFTMIETNKATVELYYGSSVVDATGLVTFDPAATGGRKAFVIDIIDGANTRRIYIAEGEVSERGGVTYANGEPIGYETTILAYTNPLIWASTLIV